MTFISAGNLRPGATRAGIASEPRIAAARRAAPPLRPLLVAALVLLAPAGLAFHAGEPGSGLWWLVRGLFATGLAVLGFAAVRAGTAAASPSRTPAGAEDEELRRRLADKEVLLAELNHRAKNGLELVSRLLALQARGAGPEVRAGLEEARRRIDTLGRLHRRLCSGDYTGTVALAPALAELCDDLAACAGAGVSVAVEAEPLALPADKAVHVLLLVGELVANACKHAFPGGRPGRVVVRVETPAPGRIAVTVEDDGVGLPGTGGTGSGGGMGLRVVRTMAAQLGGDLAVENRPGAGFRVSFPAEAEPRPLSHRPSAAGRGARVLVVDDELLAAECIAEYLEERGYCAETAVSGGDAWQAFTRDPADLVVTDLRMAGLGGGELVRRLRAGWPDLPIVVMSGQDARKVVGPEATAVIDKPVALRELEALVRRLVRPA